jgi:tRNA pseudouridine55 synthase
MTETVGNDLGQRTVLLAGPVGCRSRNGSLVADPGLVVVDKPGGMTSHDVVAKMRRLAGTRRVGHAGTLDPMATGVLLIGIERATRLLGHLALTEKEYAGTIRLGQSTVTDDAEGEVLPPAGESQIQASTISLEALRSALADLTGTISQVPPRISAIKVDGKRAYHLTRSGAAPELAARPVTIRRLDLIAVRPEGDLLDIDVIVTCSSGTYIRAIARDLGAALGTGGHLIALRRTRVGPYLVSAARTLDQLSQEFDYIPLAEAAEAAFPSVRLEAEQARLVSHGVRLPAASITADGADGPVAAFGPDGLLIALLVRQEADMQPLAVFVP